MPSTEIKSTCLIREWWWSAAALAEDATASGVAIANAATPAITRFVRGFTDRSLRRNRSLDRREALQTIADHAVTGRWRIAADCSRGLGPWVLRSGRRAGGRQRDRSWPVAEGRHREPLIRPRVVQVLEA